MLFRRRAIKFNPRSDAKRHRPGDVVRIVCPGCDHAYLATSSEALQELCKLAKIKSAAEAGSLLGRLIEESKVWVIASGTRAEVVKHDWPAVKVRITQGGLSGETAFVPHEFALPA
jgi:hypothetical protein